MTTQTTDPIACVTACDSVLMIGRASGVVNRYSLPHLTLDAQHVLRCRPQVGAQWQGSSMSKWASGVGRLARPAWRCGSSSFTKAHRRKHEVAPQKLIHLARPFPVATNSPTLQMLALNCNLTKMSIIDINGVLTFFDLTAKATGGGANTVGEHLSFERKVGSSAARLCGAVVAVLPATQLPLVARSALPALRQGPRYPYP